MLILYHLIIIGKGKDSLPAIILHTEAAAISKIKLLCKC
jgi:hypothetical protein